MFQISAWYFVVCLKSGGNQLRPDTTKEVHFYCDRCLTCANCKPKAKPRAPLWSFTTGNPMQRIHIDIVAPLPRNWIHRFRVPDSIHSDQGRKLLSIKKTLTSAYHPEETGQVENMRSILKARVEDNPATWDEHLDFYVMAYCSSVHFSTGHNPFELMFALHTSQAQLRMVVLKHLVEQALVEVHDGVAGAHLGGMQSLMKIKTRFRRPDTTKEVYFYCDRCLTCANCKPKGKPRAPLWSFTTGNPMQRNHIDIVAPLPRSVHFSTGHNPFELMFGREMRIPLDVMVGGAKDNECSYTDLVAVELHKLHHTKLLEVAQMVKLATCFDCTMKPNWFQ
ncbi:hypothetical protein pdam_00025711 [Pocillopora damicornis]|uniref:Integrase zinc-binding domain-containing protein n=1 Tax=Pocillopora damicornis TaxID=46731 RepID=A0A3M6TUK4_POCDA|nr:hypothetical protein pdam_00025711 [Pocillopora damicornis]